MNRNHEQLRDRHFEMLDSNNRQLFRQTEKMLKKLIEKAHLKSSLKNKDRGFKVESGRLKIVTELNPETIV